MEFVMPNGFEEFFEDAAEDSGIAVLDYTKSIFTFTLDEGYLSREGTFSGKRCSRTNVLTVCGSATTRQDGERVLNLEDYVCLNILPLPPNENADRVFSVPVYFVATPYSTRPAFLTFTINIQDQGTNPKIRIRVFSWDANGQPAANVKFNWNCCVNIEPIVVS